MALVEWSGKLSFKKVNKLTSQVHVKWHNVKYASIGIIFKLPYVTIF